LGNDVQVGVNSSGSFIAGIHLRAGPHDHGATTIGTGRSNVSPFANETPNTLMLGSRVAGQNPAITILANTGSGATPGRVGIGTTTPLRQLHVVGDINIHATTQGYRIADSTVLAIPGTRNLLVGREA